MACRIGPFFNHYKKKIHQLGGRIYINPDGHEWLRAKWALPVKMYWKYSEKKMVLLADKVVCDSKNIERYIKSEYGVNDTVYKSCAGVCKGGEKGCLKGAFFQPFINLVELLTSPFLVGKRLYYLLISYHFVNKGGLFS